MNDIIFHDVNGNELTRSQAFARYTSTFLTQSRYLPLIKEAKTTDIIPRGTRQDHIYKAFKRPAGETSPKYGQDWFEEARKDGREVETIVSVQKVWSTVADVWDELIVGGETGGKLIITEQMIDAHATQAAIYVDQRILEAAIALKQSSNTVVLNFADKEYPTKEEANTFAQKLLRETKKEMNRITDYEVEVPQNERVLLCGSILYDALVLSDYYKGPTVLDGSARTGRLVGEEFRGITIIEATALDPVNTSLFNVGATQAIFMWDVLGGAVLQEQNQDKIWGGNVKGYNVRVIADFGPIKPIDSLRIKFFDVGTTTVVETPTAAAGTPTPTADGGTVVITVDAKGATITASSVSSSVGTVDQTSLVDGSNTITVTGLTASQTATVTYSVTTAGGTANGTVDVTAAAAAPVPAATVSVA